ncbi:MAG: hypothetical protein ACRDQZ_00525, partial [Mycobacteriales bacterium]
AYCAPAVLFNPYWTYSTDVVPWQLTIDTAIVAVGLISLSVACVITLTARYRPFAMLAVAVPAVIIAGFLGAQGLADYGAMLSLPLAAVAILVMRDITAMRGAFIQKYQSLKSRSVVIGISVLLALPVVLFTVVPATALSLPLIKATGRTMPVDGLPYLPGALLVAAIVAFVVTQRIPVMHSITISVDEALPEKVDSGTPIAKT